MLVQPRRDRWAALRFFRQLLHAAERRPRVIITDQLQSYAAAKRLVLPNVIHRQSLITEPRTPINQPAHERGR
jgi:putative transposase